MNYPQNRNSMFNTGQRDSTLYNKQRNTMLTNPRYNRITTMATKADPRPITEASFKEQNISKIFNYLIRESYDRTLSKKYLSSPSRNDFFHMFFFIYQHIRPDYTPSTQSEQEIMEIIKELKYPGVLSKSHITAISAPNCWPHFLALLSWMIELSEYLEFIEENVPIEFTKTSSDNEEDAFIAHVIKSYVSETTVNVDSDVMSLEEFYQKGITANENEQKRLYDEIDDIKSKISEIQATAPNKAEIEMIHQKEQNMLNESQTLLTSNTKQIESLLQDITTKNALYESKVQVLDTAKKQLEDIEKEVKEQKISLDEYNKMTEMKNALDVQYESLLNVNAQKQSEINAKRNALNEKKISLIQSQINSKYNSYTNDIDLNKILSQCEEEQFDMNGVKTFFGKKIQMLTDTSLAKQNTVKEINKQCFDLHSQLINIEDQIASSQVQITELQNAKNEKENEIEKRRHIEGDYNMTEIKKYNEQIKKCEMVIQDKQKEINDIKQKEIELKQMYSQKEIETDKYIQQLQQISIDTMNFLEKTKSTNILLIRKTYKTLDEVYQKMKSES